MFTCDADPHTLRPHSLAISLENMCTVPCTLITEPPHRVHFSCGSISGAMSAAEAGAARFIAAQSSPLAHACIMSEQEINCGPHGRGIDG